MFSIGEFSKVTGLTVKTLRFYHDQGVLEPTYVDPDNGYRFYSDQKIATARAIAILRELSFSVSEIAEILAEHEDDSTILEFLEKRRQLIQTRIRDDRAICRRLEQIIRHEREALATMNQSPPRIETKTIEPVTIASVRMKGRYSDCGKGFSQLGRAMGRHICGKAMMLCHDGEYREEDADFEVCLPVRKGESTEQINVRELPGGTFLSLIHHGPYEEIHRSYAILLKHTKDNDLEIVTPSREIYHKGPGMIFKGNPKKYVTEIQIPLAG